MWELGGSLSQVAHSREILCCQNVALGHERAPIISGINLTLRSGDSIAITGPSGSGKTSLLHCMAGLLSPIGGMISIMGHDIGGASDSERSRLRGRYVGIVLQFGELIPELTVAENIALPRTLGLRGTDTEGQHEVKTLLGAVGLSGFENRWPATLSGGEVQRVAIARALFGAPTLLLADEPTGSLDSERASVVVDILLKTAHEVGAAVVIATHNFDVARRCQSRFGIEDQQLVAL